MSRPFLLACLAAPLLLFGLPLTGGEKKSGDKSGDKTADKSGDKAGGKKGSKSGDKSGGGKKGKGKEGSSGTTGTSKTPSPDAPEPGPEEPVIQPPADLPDPSDMTNPDAPVEAPPPPADPTQPPSDPADPGAGVGETPPPAEPSAPPAPAGGEYQGFGAQSKGGAGGKVIQIGASESEFAAAVAESAPRIITFRSGGTIKLKGGYMNINQPFLTIDGTSAPSPGITIQGGLLFNYKGSGAHDIILKGVRIRGGPDNIALYKTKNIVIDHCSFGPAGDGSIDVVGSKDVTISWCIFTKTNKANLVSYGASNTTVHHSIYYDTGQRNPQGQMNAFIDLRNCIVWNWSHYGTRMAGETSRINVVNCFYHNDRAEFMQHALAGFGWNCPKAYITGNMTTQGPLNPGKKNTLSSPNEAPPVDTEPVSEMVDKVLKGAGARPLDSQDQAAVSAIQSKWNSVKGSIGSMKGVDASAVEGGKVEDDPQGGEGQ